MRFLLCVIVELEDGELVENMCFDGCLVQLTSTAHIYHPLFVQFILFIYLHLLQCDRTMTVECTDLAACVFSLELFFFSIILVFYFICESEMNAAKC